MLALREGGVSSDQIGKLLKPVKQIIRTMIRRGPLADQSVSSSAEEVGQARRAAATLNGWLGPPWSS